MSAPNPEYASAEDVRVASDLDVLEIRTEGSTLILDGDVTVFAHRVAAGVRSMRGTWPTPVYELTADEITELVILRWLAENAWDDDATLQHELNDGDVNEETIRGLIAAAVEAARSIA